MGSGASTAAGRCRGRRLLHATQGGQCPAQVLVSFGIILLQSNGLLVAPDSLTGLALGGEHGAQGVAELGDRPATGGDGLAGPLFGLLLTAPLVRDHAEQTQGFSLVRLAGNYPAIKRLGLRQAAGLVVRHRRPEGFLEATAHDEASGTNPGWLSKKAAPRLAMASARA